MSDGSDRDDDLDVCWRHGSRRNFGIYLVT